MLKNMGMLWQDFLDSVKSIFSPGSQIPPLSSPLAEDLSSDEGVQDPGGDPKLNRDAQMAARQQRYQRNL